VCIKLVIIKELYYDARTTKYQGIDEMLMYVWVHIRANEICFRASIIYISRVIKQVLVYFGDDIVCIMSENIDLLKLCGHVTQNLHELSYLTHIFLAFNFERLYLFSRQKYVNACN